MNRELILKELREVWWLGAAALVVVTSAVLQELPWEWDLRTLRLVYIQQVQPTPSRVPFLQTDESAGIALMASCILATALGFWQTLGEDFRRTWSYLLFRPVSRWHVIGLKLLVGLGVTLVSTGLPLLLYAWWALTPGTHASPFAWWMTADTWWLWLSAVPAYLTAFLCGLRETRWYATRLWPAVPLGGLYFVAIQVPGMFGPCISAGLGLTVALMASLWLTIDRRDYA